MAARSIRIAPAPGPRGDAQKRRRFLFARLRQRLLRQVRRDLFRLADFAPADETTRRRWVAELGALRENCHEVMGVAAQVQHLIASSPTQGEYTRRRQFRVLAGGRV